MTNRRIEVQAQLDMVRELIRVEHAKLLAEVETVVKNLIVEPNGATLIRKRLEFGLHDNVEIWFEVGFHNWEEDRIDFGSDVWFTFDSNNNELSLNYGTIGSYSKSNMYQVRRVNLVASVFKNIEQIEAALAEIARTANAGPYRKYINEGYKYESELNKIDKEIATQARNELEATLKEGMILTYSDQVNTRYMLFNTLWGGWVIQKICNKVIKLKSPYGDVRQFDKNRILSLIQQGLVQITEAKED